MTWHRLGGVRRIAAACLCGLAAVVAPPAPAASLPSVLVVRVLDEASRQPLPNADVIDLVSGQHRFTDDRGEARLAWPPNGELRLRVRQIGFRFVDRTVRRGASALQPVDTIVVALDRVAYALPPVITSAASACVAEVDSTSTVLSASVLEQLRLGAERYETFRRAYPFRVHVERRTGTLGPDGRATRIVVSNEQVNSDRWTERYRPGRVVQRSRTGGFSVPILFLSTLAAAEFWRHHCFVARGVESLHGARVVRLEFSPATSVRTPDWAGTALVDSSTSVLRRVEFRLTGLRRNDMPRRLEGYTTFTSPSPFIVVPDTTAAVWWRRDARANGQWGTPDVAQLLSVQALTYRKATPPATAPPRP